MTNTKTQLEKIMGALESGKSLTAAQARSRFGIANLRARICELRDKGFYITSNQYTTRDGRRVVKYSLD